MTLTDFLLSYWVIVKAATLLFIYGHGLTISSAHEGRPGNIYNLVKFLHG